MDKQENQIDEEIKQVKVDEKPFKSTSSRFTIPIETFQTLADKWKTRKTGDEDLQYFHDMGGEKWLMENLQTS